MQRRWKWGLLGMVVIFVCVLLVAFWTGLSYTKRRYRSTTVGQWLNVNKDDLAAVAIRMGSEQVNYDNKVTGLNLGLNTTELTKLLNTQGFWQEMGVSDYRSPTKKVTAKGLQVNILPELANPFWAQKDTKGKVVIAVSTKVGPTGIMTVDIAPGEFVLGLSPEEQIKCLSSAFWRAMYMNTQYSPKPEGGVDQTDRDQYLERMAIYSVFIPI